MTVAERRPGRPRDESVSESITEAVLGLLAELGIRGMSMDAVATRAGVSKASIYRRWDSKEDLVIDVIGGLVVAADATSTGEIRSDLLQVLGRFGAFISELKAGSIFARLAGEVQAGSELGKHYAEAVILPRRAVIAGLITAAKERGELRQDLDVELAVDMLVGPVIIRNLMAAIRTGDDVADEKLVDALLDGWRS
jgi:AcrR family transcriptional regulator